MSRYRAVLLAAMLPWLSSGCEQAACGERPLPRIPLTIGAHRLTAEVASTVDARECGLAQRDHLADGHGMLFVFEDERTLTFWMKDTRIPLSIAFIDDQHEIIDIQQMQPNWADGRYRSRVPARYALETHQGWFADRGIAAGTRVTFRLPAR